MDTDCNEHRKCGFIRLETENRAQAALIGLDVPTSGLCGLPSLKAKNIKDK